MSTHSLVLRLAAPIQSWGGQSEFNRRDTLPEPTKSGVVGLLAAADGRRRQDPIEDLVALTLGVRIDQPGTLLRDYHTVSNLDRSPLPSAQVNAKGAQKRTSPAKVTHITTRFYLQDAVFVAAVCGPADLLLGLTEALRNPAFPLALGRRCCAPTQPLLLTPTDHDETLWPGPVSDVLNHVPWQASEPTRRRTRTTTVRLPTTIDDLKGNELRGDVPGSFDPLNRHYTTRPVSHGWAEIPSGTTKADNQPHHDPFALLGW